MKPKKTTKTAFFTCSTTNFADNRDNYVKVIELFRSQGVKVTSNINLEEFISDVAQQDYSNYSNSSVYFSTMKKIAQADMLVVDCSVHSMNIGHIVTYALSNKKPVLLISREKKDDPQDLFISGSDDIMLDYKLYQPKDLPLIVKSFLRKVEKEPRVRLNFVVDKDLSDRIDWLAFRTKKSKTDILRLAIINLNDKLD